MAARSRFIAISLLFFLIGSATALISSETFIPSAPKDLRDAIVKGLGFQDLKVSGFDVRDALVGQSVAYEFDVEVDKKVFPIKLLEDMSRWDFFNLPIFKVEGEEEDKALAERGRSKKDSMVLPVLPPFELAGPMELWIQDGDDMRLSLLYLTLKRGSVRIAKSSGPPTTADVPLSLWCGEGLLEDQEGVAIVGDQQPPCHWRHPRHPPSPPPQAHRRVQECPCGPNWMIDGGDRWPGVCSSSRTPSLESINSWSILL